MWTNAATLWCKIYSPENTSSCVTASCSRARLEQHAARESAVAWATSSATSLQPTIGQYGDIRRDPYGNSDAFLRCSLDSCADFCFDRNVPVDEDHASESQTTASAQKASIVFTTTHWSVVLEAQGQSPAA